MDMTDEQADKICRTIEDAAAHVAYEIERTSMNTGMEEIITELSRIGAKIEGLT